MSFYTAADQKRIHFIILVSGAALFIVYVLAFPSLEYFWDPSVKWFQILDLLDRGWGDISCKYPAAPFDPDFRFSPIPYTTGIGGRCFYWFPFQLSYVLAPLYKLFGVWSVPIFQQVMSFVVLYGIVEFAGRLEFSCAKTTAAILLFRFGTANAAAVHNLEDHTITQALAVGSMVIGLGGNRVSLAAAGALIGLSFGFRQETILLAPFILAALWWMRRAHAPLGVVDILIFGFSTALSLSIQLALNHVLVGHMLGLRAVHGPHLDFWNVTMHVRRAAGHLFWEWPWLPNGMLFQMPLLVLVPWNLRRTSRSPTAVGLVILVLALLPLLWISPGGGPHIGYRFAQPIVPFLILLALRPIHWTAIGVVRKALVCVSFAFSILVAGGVAAFGSRVYKGYKDAEAELRSLPGGIIILRDSETWAALGRLYREKPVMQIVDDKDVVTALDRIRMRAPTDVIFVKSTMVNSGSVVPPGLRTDARGRGRLFEWAVLHVQGTAR